MEINVNSIDKYVKSLASSNLFSNQTLADKVITKTTETLCSMMNPHSYSQLSKVNRSIRIN
jgi:hypothetical protein